MCTPLGCNSSRGASTMRVCSVGFSTTASGAIKACWRKGSSIRSLPNFPSLEKINTLREASHLLCNTLRSGPPFNIAISLTHAICVCTRFRSTLSLSTLYRKQFLGPCFGQAYVFWLLLWTWSMPFDMGCCLIYMMENFSQMIPEARTSQLQKRN